jgi:hypothetical protein
MEKFETEFKEQVLRFLVIERENVWGSQVASDRTPHEIMGKKLSKKN